MRITPLDVRKQEFRRGVRGLDADEVYAFLATVADEYEVVLTDNKKLRDRVIELDEKVNEYRNMEKTLRDTLLTAERVMSEARQNARKEADLILRDAQMKASQEVAGINGRVEALHQQLRELRGHRDSYLARLHSLSEAQLSLIESYRRDFEINDHRVFGAADDEEPSPRSVDRPQASRHPAQPSIPAWDRPSGTEAAGGGDDRWRGYDLGDSGSVSSHLHTPDPTPQDDIQLEGPDLGEDIAGTGSSAPASQAEIAAMAEAWSGRLPRVEDPELAEGEARAIDEVSAAMGMFHESGESLPEAEPLEGESQSVPTVHVDSGPVDPASPSSDELASGAVPTEPVDRSEGADDSAQNSIEASAGSDPDETSEGGKGGWSLSRIARGLTGH